MKIKIPKQRNPHAGEKGHRSWGAGAHRDKKKEINKKTCRKKVGCEDG